MTRLAVLPAAVAAVAFATTSMAQTVALSPATGHPTQVVSVTGSSFANAEAVDLYLDTTDTLLLVSSGTGTLSASLTIPASAAPGTHYITAIGRRSGDAAQMAFTVSTPWLQPGYGAASQNFNPYENTIAGSNVVSLGQRWSAANVNASGATPAVSGGKVFNATTAGLQALSTTTGAVLWTALPAATFIASPAVAGSSVYIASTSNNVYSINAANGHINWTVSLGSYIYSSPVVSGGIVYVGCNDHKLYALQASTGKILWTYTTGAGIDSAPAVAAGIVYVGSEDDSLYALNAATGALLWSYATSGQIEAAPAVANGIVYASSDDGKAYALRAVASPFGGLAAGSLLWSATGAAYVSPAAAHGKVFYGYSTLYAANSRTGGTVWSFAPDTNLRGHIVVANGVVYATSASGILYALDEAEGIELWHAQSGSPYLGGLSISDGVVYVNAYQVGTSAYALSAGSDVLRRHAPDLRSLHPDWRLVVTR